MKTQEQIIDQIQSLGDQILFFDEERSFNQSKEQFDQLIDRHYRSLDKNTLKQQKQKLQIIPKLTPPVSRKLTNLKDLLSKQKIDQIKRKSNLKEPQQIQTKKTVKQPIQSKLSQAQISKNKMNSQIKIPLINTKSNKKQAKIVQSKFNPKSELNYRRLVDRNLQKIVNQMKQLKKVKAQAIKQQNVQRKSALIAKQSGNFNQKSNKFDKKQDLLSMTTRTRLNQSFQSIHAYEKALFQKKQHKIDLLRSQKYRKEMQNVTFKPQTFTSNYKPKNNLSLKEENNLNHFYLRLGTDNEIRTNNQIKKMAQVMEECSFKPRLNVSTKNVDSIVKSIWNSQQKSLQKEIKIAKSNRSIQKLNKSIYMSNQGFFKQTSVQIPVFNTQQLNFLF